MSKHKFNPLILAKVQDTQTREEQANAGVSSLGVPGVPWHKQILADQLTLSQPGGTDYAHLITTLHPRIFRPSDGPVLEEDG